MTRAEIWKMFGRIVQFYPNFAARSEEDDEARVEAWHEILRDVPFDRAMVNLKRYVSDPVNRFPPHPGILAADLSSESEMYHEYMITAGRQMLDEHNQRLEAAVPPPSDVSRKVREILASRAAD